MCLGGGGVGGGGVGGLVEASDVEERLVGEHERVGVGVDDNLVAAQVVS